jgi:hypothetical protein
MSELLKSFFDEVNNNPSLPGRENKKISLCHIFAEALRVASAERPARCSV